METGNFWKYGLALGAGVMLGAAGAVLLSRGNIDLKKTCATLLSHGMDLKDKAAEFAKPPRKTWMTSLPKRVTSKKNARREKPSHEQ